MVEVKDLGIGRLKRQMAKFGSMRVQVGIHKDEGRKPHPEANGPTIAEVAAWLEYGTKRQPARPFLRSGMEVSADKLKAELKRGLSDLIDGRASSAAAVMQEVAEKAKAAVLKHFDNAREWAAPLAPSTAAAKGHSQPLINSAVVREAIDAKVVTE
jgi:hypothetical protein